MTGSPLSFLILQPNTSNDVPLARVKKDARGLAVQLLQEPVSEFSQARCDECLSLARAANMLHYQRMTSTSGLLPEVASDSHLLVVERFAIHFHEARIDCKRYEVYPTGVDSLISHAVALELFGTSNESVARLVVAARLPLGTDVAREVATFLSFEQVEWIRKED